LQIIQVISLISEIIFIIIIIMSFALSKRVESIKKDQGFLDWKLIHIVDPKTNLGCSVEELMKHFNDNIRGLFSTIGILGIALYYIKQNPMSVNSTYATIFILIILFFGWIFTYSNVMDSNIIINNLVNRYRQ
jgi:hypothetical protein